MTDPTKREVERLRYRIAALLADRSRIKAFNVSCFERRCDPLLLTPRQRQRLRDYLARKDSYIGLAALPELRRVEAEIARCRTRLVELETY